MKDWRKQIKTGLARRGKERDLLTVNRDGGGTLKLDFIKFWRDLAKQEKGKKGVGTRNNKERI